jgi:alcohol dehydrogenase (cytochrome c)
VGKPRRQRRQLPTRVIATNKETGKVVWETNMGDGQPDLQLTAAPLAVKDKIVIGAAGGDRGTRDFIAALDGATGRMLWRKYTVPAPGEPGSETWKDKNNAWQTGGGAMWVTGSYDVATNQVLWGTGNPAPMYNPYYRPGDNLYTNSLISWDPDTGKMNWYHQYVPGDMWDYDAAGTHILIDGEVSGQPHKLVTHSARNGFLYAFERTNGQTLLAKPLHGRNHLDQRHRSEDRPADRLRSHQGHPGLFGPAKSDLDGPHQEAVPLA